MALTKNTSYTGDMDISRVDDQENKDCTVIILSYNTKDVTDECLSKVEASVAYCEKELGNKVDVVVVDNGSSDGSADMIRSKYPHVTLKALEKNVGYPKGNNIAMREAQTPYMLLLNSDSYVRVHTLADSLMYMQRHPGCDILSARLLYLDGSFQSFGGYLPTPFRTIRWAFGFESIPFFKRFMHPIYQRKQSFYRKERLMDWATTGFFLLRKKVYDLTQGFDESLFLYMEDVEWCRRIKDKNLKICYSPDIDIVHLGGFSAKKLPSANLLRRHAEGVLYFHKIHYPRAVRLVAFCLVLGFGIRALFFALLLQTSKATTYWSLIESIDIFKGTLG